MTALDRKLFRDLSSLRGQMIAIALVIACGISTFVLSLCNLYTLETSRTEFYDRYRFADVFAHLKRAPQSLAQSVARLPGVTRVQARIAAEVTLNLPDMSEPASGRIISLPPYGTAGLNRLYILRGRDVEPGRPNEVVVGEAFAQAHRLRPGDTVSAVMNGRSQLLHIVGVVLSPEYVFQVRPGDILPDDRHYGVFWMNETQMAAAFDMTGAFNDLSLSLSPGANEAAIKVALDYITAPWGGTGSYGRDEHPSDRYVSDELKQLRAMGFVMPAIFLSVAAFLLNVVLSRVVQTQREQIAALKAFGYGRVQIATHYLKLTTIVVLAGGILGIAVGYRLGQGLTADYARFYRFPHFEFHLDIGVVATALLVSVAAGVVGVVGSVWRAARLPPAEAMRPESPTVFRPLLAERLGLHHWLSASARMVLRNIERKPFRAGLSVLGIAMAVSTLIVGLFSADLFDFVTEFQFFTTQRQDMTVGFTEPTSGRVAHDLAHLPGVRACESFRSVAVQLKFGARARRTAIMGLPPDRRLWRLLDQESREVALPAHGLLLSAKMAEVLGCRPGDTLTVEVLEADRRVRQVPVTGLVDEFSGTTVYMRDRALNALMNEGDARSGALLSIDRQHADRLYATLKNSPRVASITIKTAALKTFNQTLAENIRKMRIINVVFAMVIAGGVIYNAARISLSERSRDLASLRVLGFTRREISGILLGELSVLTLAAIPLGCGLGFGLAVWIVRVFSTETLSFPVVIYPRTFGIALAVVLAAAAASSLYVRRRLDELDLVGVLKSRE
jgi:putative ABC transport system permease protein